MKIESFLYAWASWENCVPVDLWNTLFKVTSDVTGGTTISQRTLTASLLLYVPWWGCCSGGRQGRGGRVLVLVSDELTTGHPDYRTAGSTTVVRWRHQIRRQGKDVEAKLKWPRPCELPMIGQGYSISISSHFIRISARYILKLCCTVRPKAHGRPLPQSKGDKTTDYKYYSIIIV